MTSGSWVVVGLDNGGTCNNATVLDDSKEFLIGSLVETPSRVREGPEIAVEALASSFEQILSLCGKSRQAVRAVGLDTPGPSSADGIISSKGATNFSEEAWRGFDIRAAVEERIGIPVVYNNDGNAAALYAHHASFGNESSARSSVSAIVGTGLGGGIVESGRVIVGASGMAGELGHVQIPLQGILQSDQPVPRCNCGFAGDAESIASLTGIEKNLLPYWLTRFPKHELWAVESIDKAAKMVRDYGQRKDPMALAIFSQQAMALGRLFTITSNVTDPDAYFLGGGVVEGSAHFRQWFLDEVEKHVQLREEQRLLSKFALIPHLDMAGARGSALAAYAAVEGTLITQ